jgi:hypothetical protein
MYHSGSGQQSCALNMKNRQKLLETDSRNSRLPFELHPGHAELNRYAHCLPRGRVRCKPCAFGVLTESVFWLNLKFWTRCFHVFEYGCQPVFLP